MLTLPCPSNWQKFSNKMIEKNKSVVSEYGHPEYVTRQINRRFETMLLFEFCTALKVLICFSLIKPFPNNRKRYSSHLQVSILHRVAPVKVYLTIYENLKNSYLKNVFVP